MKIAKLLIGLRYPPVWLCACAALGGVAAQLQQTALWSPEDYGRLLAASVGSAGLAPALGLARHARALRSGLAGWVGLQCAVLLLAWAGGAFALVGLRACSFDAQRLDPALEGRDVQVVGVVRDLTHSDATVLRFQVHVESAQLDARAVQLPPRINVGWYRGLSPRSAGAEPTDWELQSQPQDLLPGQRWQFTLRVKAPHGSRNPQGFDYELWLWTQGVQATCYVRAGSRDAAPVLLGDTGTYPVAALRQQVRARIFAQVPDPQAAGLIAALVVGDQAAIDRADWDVFRATGVAHLVSISGLHITMFAWGAMAVVGWLWRRSQRLCLWLPATTAALVGGVLLALAYSLFSGWGVPAQRTCIMLASVAALRILGLRWPWPQVWLLAFCAVVASHPWALLQAGFWLSFVAVGVLFASDPGRQKLEPGSRPVPMSALAHDPRDQLDTVALPPAQQGKHRPVWMRWLLAAMHTLRGGLRTLVGEQWTITLALAPLTVLLFGQMSVVGLLANVLAVPWVTLVLTPLAMLGVLFAPFWLGAALAVDALMAVLQSMAAWPGAVLLLAAPPWWLAVLAVGGGVLLVLPGPWSLRLLGLPLLLAVPLWRAPVPAPGEFGLIAADVGQGNAVLVRTAQHALLYDAGPRYSLDSDAGHRVLVPLLQATQTRLDRLVLSHRDTDHVGGAAAVLATQPQADVLSSLTQDQPLLAGRASQRCEAGQRWTWDGVHFEVLHPSAQDYLAQPPPKPNALSCVLRISGRTASALLAGDIERPQEVALLARQGEGLDHLRSTVLLAPHHGSKTSSSAEFLAAVQPAVVLVQVGYRNRYGHPAPEVLARYQALEASFEGAQTLEIFDSPHCGAFLWQSHLPHNGVCERSQGQRYWHHRMP
jgi:competence protein ComEC